VCAERDLCEIVFVGITNNDGNAGQGGNFAGGALGVAAGNYYFAGGIFAADAAEGGAGVLFGGSGDGAGVQNNDFRGSRAVGAVEAAVAELLLYSGSVGLGGAAAEIFDVKAGHRTILAYARQGWGTGISAAPPQLGLR